MDFGHYFEKPSRRRILNPRKRIKAAVSSWEIDGNAENHTDHSTDRPSIKIDSKNDCSDHKNLLFGNGVVEVIARGLKAEIGQKLCDAVDRSIEKIKNEQKQQKNMQNIQKDQNLPKKYLCSAATDMQMWSESINKTMSPNRQELTQIHLRRAKLLFLYVRYPTSQALQRYFPEVNFTKGIVSQMVKWFSNFREFFYKQIEKYARKLVVDCVKAESIRITPCHKLYRTLLHHYAKTTNPTIIPESFIFVVEQCLKKFVVSLLNDSDAQNAWKKPIYKAIQQMDYAPEMCDLL